VSAARDIAAAFIAQREGFSAVPYQDTAGVWTIGNGSTHDVNGDRVTADTPEVSQDDALALLERDLGTAADAVDEAVSVPLTDVERAALYSFTYNEGVKAFGGSTLLADLNAGNMAAAEAQFARWDIAGGKKSHGLDNRRAAELALFEQVGSASTGPG